MCLCAGRMTREDSPLWLLLFVRCDVKVLSLCSLTPTRQADTQTSCSSCWCCLVWSPFFLFSVHFETATLRGRSSPAEPRKGFRIYDYFLSGISGSLIIPPMAGSNNNKKRPAGKGGHFILYGCLIKSHLRNPSTPFVRHRSCVAPRPVPMRTFVTLVGAK
jgi:hypothetical protein